MKEGEKVRARAWREGAGTSVKSKPNDVLGELPERTAQEMEFCHATSQKHSLKSKIKFFEGINGENGNHFFCPNSLHPKYFLPKIFMT